MTTMDSSFYYFFSATPQVLGAILGLFSVIIIFKIQAVKSDLIAKATAILSVLKTKVRKKVTKSISTTSLIKELETAIAEKSVFKIAIWLTYIEPHKIEEIEFSISIFDREVAQLKDLIKYIIYATYITSGTIIYCLILIPLGPTILKYTELLFPLFIIGVSGVAMSLHFYIFIFRMCIELRELRFTFPLRRDDEKEIPSPTTNLINWIKSIFSWKRNPFK
jgi:hypothetical protein